MTGAVCVSVWALQLTASGTQNQGAGNRWLLQGAGLVAVAWLLPQHLHFFAAYASHAVDSDIPQQATC